MAKIFVTTYAAYNDGRQFAKGQYFDFADYADADELAQAARELYSDEPDPEFMVTDYEDFPREWYSESGLPDDRLFSLIKGYSEADDDDREMIDAFLSLRSEHWNDWDSLEEAARDAYQGHFKSDEDFAYDLAESMGMLSGVNEDFARYFDYAAFARDLMMGDYSSADGHYFRD